MLSEITWAVVSATFGIAAAAASHSICVVSEAPPFDSHVPLDASMNWVLHVTGQMDETFVYDRDVHHELSSPHDN